MSRDTTPDLYGPVDGDDLSEAVHTRVKPLGQSIPCAMDYNRLNLGQNDVALATSEFESQERSGGEPGEEPAATTKRKRRPDVATPTNGIHSSSAEVKGTTPNKRSKYDRPQNKATRKDVQSQDDRMCGLTRSIWQRILSNVPPTSLGRMLPVSRIFNAILTPEVNLISGPIVEKPQTEVSYANQIWAISRQHFDHTIPSPPTGQTELEMWQLIKGERCQGCGKKKHLITTSACPDLWSAGPGTGAMRVIWPFGLRACGGCLVRMSDKVSCLSYAL